MISKIEHNLPVFSFFTGSGFLDLGFKNAGFQILAANELNRKFIDAYLYGLDSVRKKTPTNLYDCSIQSFLDETQKLPSTSSLSAPLGFIGGPPCPDFSAAGKHLGSKGENGKLTESYIDLICKVKPDWFLMENVKGLWKTRKHREFYEKKCTLLCSSGYQLTHNLINTIEFGVPQNRERVILLGFRAPLLNKRKGGWLPTDLFPWRRYTKFDAKRVFALPWLDKTPFGEEPTMPKDCLKTLTVEHWFTRNRVTNHVNSEHHFMPRTAKSKFENVWEGDVSGKSFKRLHRWRFSPTAAYGNNEVHLHPYNARRLSASEALAIQSLPKDFALPPDMSLSSMFKTIANGVPYLASNGIAQSVRDFLLESQS